MVEDFSRTAALDTAGTSGFMEGEALRHSIPANQVRQAVMVVGCQYYMIGTSKDVHG